MSRRLPDLIAAFEDPGRLPSMRRRWEQLQLARGAGYDFPWSHAVLRSLELRGMPQGLAAQRAWIARHLCITHTQVSQALTLLEHTAQVRRTARGYRLLAVMAIDTGHDPERARALRIAWLETALQRLKANTPGKFGYSVFAVSKASMLQLHNLHLEYVRAMQVVIARSNPSECVGLYCSQLLNLGDQAMGSRD
jgi:hypothetical protein